MIIKEALELSETLDSDSEMAIEITIFDEYKSIWINKEEALKIIDHLKRVFNHDSV